MQIKNNIKWLIVKSGKSQKEIAAQLGVSAQQLNNWINSRQFPRIDKALELAKILGVTLNDLYEIID
ncbi:helix-turn-helix transcriptional regulator [Schinkia azotoformans]|uniref:helix-turn-helix transcriptional regulator n=1 Tax=Schinkia azotoformans TaxID=1454 RepID=UPI002DBA5B8C|nr:helix-turn-helix transcriptional regulator [Schinkia azotoformans]MEC1778389.1 helix-turn-helix transcriptional regulator [Schinkia azotoformans]MED4328366.1 helix-turn-helix transcriptional regulator [Schinkia azotoformans]